MQDRKIVRVPIATELIGEFPKLSEYLFKCHNPIPVDAKLVSFFADPERCLIYLVYEHESFEPIALGRLIPEWKLEFTKKN